MNPWRVFAIALLLATGLPAHAAPPPGGAKITLDAQAGAETANDVMHATLYVEMEDVEPATLADAVNRAMNEALAEARGIAGLRVRTAGYSSYPVTDGGRIVRWRARSEMALEGSDFGLMADAIGRLQSRLNLGSVSFSVSPASRKKAEDELTQAAVAEFQRKARLAARAFGAKSFRVLEAAISSDGGHVPPRPMMMMKSMSDGGVAAPAMEGGTTRITVTVNGAILIPR